MAADVSILAALFAGVISFLSPCVLPLVPPYLVYLAGASLERLADKEPEPRVKRDAVIAACLFVLGFSTVFVALGASASLIGGLIRAYSDILSTIAGIAIIVMGLHFLGLTRLAFLMREKRAEMVKPVGLWGAYVMGLAFAFGWTPCIGPILAAILAVAASEATVSPASCTIPPHRESLDRIVPRDRDLARAVTHHNVLALPDDLEARLFQGADRVQVVDARKAWHGYTCTSTSRTSAP